MSSRPTSMPAGKPSSVTDEKWTASLNAVKATVTDDKLSQAITAKLFADNITGVPTSDQIAAAKKSVESANTTFLVGMGVGSVALVGLLGTGIYYYMNKKKGVTGFRAGLRA